MKIIETTIPDIKGKSIDEQKIDLANEIINQFIPNISESYKSNNAKIIALENEIQTKRKIIKEEKDLLNKLVKENKAKDKMIKLIDRIEKLYTMGKLKDKKIFNELSVVIKNIHFFKENKLDQYLAETINILTKNAI